MAPTTATRTLRCTVRPPRAPRGECCHGVRGPLSPLVVRPADGPSVRAVPTVEVLPAVDGARARGGVAAAEGLTARTPAGVTALTWAGQPHVGGCPPVPRRLGDAGMATAEYAIATLAACGFAGLLLALLASDQVRGLLLGIVQSALSVG